jgi:hypothetical protein
MIGDVLSKHSPQALLALEFIVDRFESNECGIDVMIYSSDVMIYSSDVMIYSSDVMIYSSDVMIYGLNVMIYGLNVMIYGLNVMIYGLRILNFTSFFRMSVQILLQCECCFTKPAM